MSQLIVISKEESRLKAVAKETKRIFGWALVVKRVNPQSDTFQLISKLTLVEPYLTQCRAYAVGYLKGAKDEANYWNP